MKKARKEETSLGVRLSRAVATIERQKVMIERLTNELQFTKSHLLHHHPTNGTCGWERDLLIALATAKESGE